MNSRLRALRNRIGSSGAGLLAAGGGAGFAIALLLAPVLRDFFHPPEWGFGLVAALRYPKGFDHFFAVFTSLAVACGAIGLQLVASLLRRTTSQVAGDSSLRSAPFGMTPDPTGDKPDPRQRCEESLATKGWARRLEVFAAALLIFTAYFFGHDSRYHEMDLFHEGEHLSPAAAMRDGGRPFGDVFLLHGFFVDGGLDLLALGDPPSPLRVRIAQTVLDAATLALLAPIAAELVVTGWAFAAALMASLFALGSGQVLMFPYFRLAPLLLCVWLMLIFIRTERARWVWIASAIASLGILWSLEVGLYSCAALIPFLLVRDVLGAFAGRRARLRLPPTAIAAVAIPAALLIALLLIRADLKQFAIDTFVILPRSIDAVWSIPAPEIPKSALAWLDSEPARYYLPPAISGIVLALAIWEACRGRRSRAEALLLIALFSMAVFRTATGRAGWSHSRFGVPLLGIALLAFVIEPLIRSKRRWGWIGAIAAIVFLVPFLEITRNSSAFAKGIAGWRSRTARPAGTVPHPLPAGRGLFTNEENARELLLLADAARRHAPNGRPIFIFSGEKALYYLLNRPSPARVQDVPMMSSPPLLEETFAQLERNPPAFVVVSGPSRLDQFDGVTNRDRVPELAKWIDERYPVRENVGRYVIGLPPG